MSELRRRRRSLEEGQSGDEEQSQQETQAAHIAIEYGTDLGDDEDECVICYYGTERGPLITPCSCVDARYYHYQCICTWIITRRDQPCRVCHEVYSDPRIVRTRTVRDFVQRNNFLLTMFGITTTTFFGMTGSGFFELSEPDVTERTIACLSLFGCVVMNVIGVLIMAGDYWRNNQDIHFRDFDGRNYVRGTDFIYRLQEAVDAYDREILERETAVQQNEPLMDQMRAEFEQLAQVQPPDQDQDN